MARPISPGAREWFARAAEYGIRDSQYNLAVLLARGLGGEQDLAESFKWFAIAAEQGDTDAAGKRDEVAARLDERGPAPRQRLKSRSGAPASPIRRPTR